MRPRDAALLVDLFTGAVCVSVAVALAGLTWRLFDLATHRAPEPLAPGLVMARNDAVDIAPILALAPFGIENDGAARPTTLPIELRGVMLTVPRAASSVLIAPSGGTPVAYRIGQALPAGGTIESVGVDSVTLVVGGHRELLAFPKRAGAGATPAGDAGQPSAPPPLVAPAGIAVSTNAPAGPQGLLDSLGASPVNGGYRIGESLSPAARQAGLLPGDVIDQVNGTLLGNPAMDQQTIATAARAGDVRVDLIRNGRRTTISVPLR